jgi:hypothetical protein
MRPRRRAAIAVVMASCALACGSRRGSSDGPGAEGGDGGFTEAGDDSEPEASPGDDEGGEAGFLGDGSTVSNCAPEASLIYVATEEKELYSFDPTTNTFTLLWDIDCASGSYVNSMAVDRSGNAWVNYGDGSLWEVPIKTGKCTSTGFMVDQQGVGLFGMGFASKSPGSNDETLFICDLTGGGLGYIDLTTMTLQRYGPFAGSLAGASAELTGTGDARLFGFFEGSPLGDAGAASVVQIDPTSEAAIKQYSLPTIDTGSDWAFSFWGGDFYLYTADKYDENAPDTVVTRFRPSDGSLTVLDAQLGFRIVGAGSSTCAPTTPAQ